MVDVLALPQLDVSTYSSQLFWLVLCCTSLYFFVKGVYFPRVRANLGKREAYVKKNRQDAEAADALAEKLRASQDEKFAQDSADAAALVSGIMQEAQGRERASRIRARLDMVELLNAAELETRQAIEGQRVHLIAWGARLAVALYKKTTGDIPDISEQELLDIVEGRYADVESRYIDK